jgi:hypothetical protein
LVECMLARTMRLNLLSKRLIACGALALLGTFIPRKAGMSLHNDYWTLGWPVTAHLTVYGPSSGYSGTSMPFLPNLAWGFALWLGSRLYPNGCGFVLAVVQQPCHRHGRQVPSAHYGG